MLKQLKKRKSYKDLKCEDDCRQYLYNLKWGKGFCCTRCRNTKCWKGRTEFHARCTSCDYDESVTANTIFHNIQIPLLKAFSIAVHVTVYKKGLSCRNLSTIVSVSLKAVWNFKRKVQDIMGACVSAETKENCQVKIASIDGIILSHRGKNLNGLQKVKLNLYKTRRNDLSKIRCTEGIPDSTLLDPCSLVAGRYVNEGKDLLFWNFKAWLTGTHHHCSEKYLKGYLDEYCFRFNNRGKKDRIWSTLISKMISSNSNV